MFHRSWPWTLLIPLCWPAAGLADDNTAGGDQSLLAIMDEPTVARLLAFAEKAASWNERVAAEQRRFQQAGGAEPTLKNLLAVLAEIEAEIKPLAPEARKYLPDTSRLRGAFDQAEASWKSRPFDRDQSPGLDEKSFRRQARAEAYAAAAAEFGRFTGEELSPAIEKLREPARYARDFLSGKFQEWLQQPLESGGLRFRILPGAKKSVFSQDAQLTVELEYLPGQLKVKATGLYFDYVPGGLPTPNLSRLSVDASESLKGKAISGLTALGEEFTADLNMPLKVTITGPPDFSASGGGRLGALPFGIEMGLFDSDTVKAKAENLLLYPNPMTPVDWGAGKLTIDVPLEAPVPIGTTPFGFWKMGGDYAVKTRELGFDTKISTLATPPESVALDVRVSTALPVKQLTLAGKIVLLGGAELGQVKGTIDFSRGVISGEVLPVGSAGGLPIGLGQGSFELRSERLMADASIKLLNHDLGEMRLVVNFSDASASLAAQGQVSLFGADFAATFDGQVAAEFKRVRFEAVESIRVSGIEPYGTIDVAVIVRADTSEGVEVEVKAFLPELSFTVKVPTLADCTLDQLEKWLQDRAVAAYHQFLRNLAQGEKDGREWAAKVDEKTRDYVAARLGGAWKTGDPALDAYGKELSDFSKQAGGAWHDFTEQAGGGLAQAWHGALDTASSLPIKPPW